MLAHACLLQDLAACAVALALHTSLDWPSGVLSGGSALKNFPVTSCRASLSQAYAACYLAGAITIGLFCARNWTTLLV